MSVSFEGKIFCFTGGLSELKRAQAEKEVRARKGYTQNVINDKLDYLVLGSIPAVGWKHGNYGNKIEKARNLISNGCSIQIISEHDFMILLENTPGLEGGELSEKVLVCRYSGYFRNGDLRIDNLEDYLGVIADIPDTHITAYVEEPFIYRDLYNRYSSEEIKDLLLFQSRIVRRFPLDEDTQPFVDNLISGFDSISGLDGNLSWSIKQEGTASFVKLLNEIPVKTNLL